MGRPPAKKAAENDSQPQKCASCTTRLKAPSAIYHTGDVGKHCHIAAEIRRKAEEQKKAEKKKGTGYHTRSSTDTSPKTPKFDAMQKEIEALKKKFESTLPKDSKRKRSQSSDESTSESESESDEEEPSPKRKHKRKEHRKTHSSRRAKGSIGKSIYPILAALPNLANTNVKAKSGETRTAVDRAPANVKWPHEWIRSPDPKTVVTPHNMTLAQFVFGYLQCVDNAGIANSPYMITHLKLSMQEVDQYGWDAVRTLNLTLFQQLESGEITWPQISGMQWFQTKMSFYGTVGPLARNTGCNMGNSADQHASAPIRKSSVNPCPAFQLDKCQKLKDHDGFKHVCAYHYSILGGKHLFPHGEVNCKLKTSHIEAGARSATSTENLQ